MMTPYTFLFYNGSNADCHTHGLGVGLTGESPKRMKKVMQLHDF
jgi:hypothetical protein